MKAKNSTEQLLYEDGHKKFEYYAFVSYKHGDKKWAKWVQKRIELYRLPVELLKENQIFPEYVSPICRDDTDLSGGKSVEWSLSDKVAKSKYLIVICSRKMQQNPKYIDFEIEAFLAAGNPVHRIIPFVIDGEPNSADPAKECLPPALKKLGDKLPVCVILNRHKRRESTIKLVASILELEPKALRSHDQAHRQRQAIIGLILGTVFLAGLVSFVMWQLLKVKEAQLNEQLSYAEDTFRQGDRLRANGMALAVKDDYLPTMDKEIKKSASALSRLSEIHPKYQPLTALCQDMDGSRAMFTTDGEYVLIISESLVRKYSLTGELVMSFETPEGAHRIVDVSADGTHAVVMTTFVSDYETELWLWDMEKDKCLTYLVGSGRYSSEDSKEGNFSTVVNACFSPDGSIVCAYRDGRGAFNECEELAAWDCESGTKLFSFPGELLGDGNQSYEVNEFRFIGSDTMYWHGTKNHVFYTLGDDEPIVVSRRSMPDIRNKAISSFSDVRYYIDRSCGLVKNVVTGQSLQIDFDIPFSSAAENAAKLWEPYELNERYALINCLALTDNSSLLCDIKLLDLESMSIKTCAEDFAALCRGKSVSYRNNTDSSACIYVFISGQGLYRFDYISGEYLKIDIENAESYEYIGRYNDTDVIAARDGGGLSIVEIEGMDAAFYSLDTDQDEFLSSAMLSPDGTDPHLLSKHNGSYCLFPLSNPGILLEDEASPSAKYAVGEYGNLIVMGSGKILKAWQNEELLVSMQLLDNILSVGADAEGRWFVLTPSQLDLYDNEGMKLGSISPAAGRIFRYAKLAADGDRLAILSGQDSHFADNAYTLELYDSGSLEFVSAVSHMVHVAPGGLSEIAFDLSPGGKWLGAVVRITEKDSSQYQLGIYVWNGSDGSLAAQTQNINQVDVPVFELLNQSVEAVASASRMRYLTFPSDNELLCGLQYGSWVMDMNRLKTRSFVAESYPCDALPDMLADGRLLYPSSGVHIWSVGEDANRLENVLFHKREKADGIAIFDPENLRSMRLSDNKQWLAVCSGKDCWIYSTQNWEHRAIGASQPVEVLYMDDVRFIYVTAEGLLYSDKQNEKDGKP